MTSLTPEQAATQYVTKVTKGATIYQTGGVLETDQPGVYLVRSQSDTYSYYKADLNTRACTCRDYLHRGGTCKHLAAAEMHQQVLWRKAA